jgi:hypothetical protein
METIEALRIQKTLAEEHAHDAGSISSWHNWVWLKPIKLGGKLALIGGGLHLAKSEHPDLLAWMQNDYSFLSVSANQLDHLHLVPETLDDFLHELPFLGLSMAAWAGFCYIRSMEYERHAQELEAQIKKQESH